MPKWIPPRPRYKRERRTVGFMLLAAFLLSLLARLFGDLIKLPAREILFPLILFAATLFLPPLAYLLFRGRGYMKTLRLPPPRREHLPLLLAALVAMLTGSFLFSCLTGGVDTLGNTLTHFNAAAPEHPLMAVLFYLVVGLLPALFEPFLFFGITTVEYERRGSFRAVLLSSLLFALFHFDLKNLVAYLFLGLLSMLVLYTTNSLFSLLLLHLFYNAIFLLAGPYIIALYRYTGSLALFLFIMIFLFLLSLALLVRLCARVYRRREEQGIGEPRRAVPYNVQFYTTLDALGDPAIIATLAIVLTGFILL